MSAYFVTELKNKPSHLQNDSKAVQYLKKWSLADGLHSSSWSFNEPYQPHRVKDLVSSVLSQAINSKLLPINLNLSNVDCDPIACSVISMEFFDRLLDPANGIVNRSGDGGIRGCFEEHINEIPVCDELRQMLLNENSDVYALYSTQERNELLFLILCHLAVGGTWCQYEDYINPYIDMAILMYKSILRVQKNKDTGIVEIRSKCFRIKLKSLLNAHDFIYVTVDPGLREVTLLSHLTKQNV